MIPGSDPLLWPLICMAGVLASTLAAPLTAITFALGLTGNFKALLPLLLTTCISYGFIVLALRRSIMTEKIARRGFHIYREYSVAPQERVFVEEVMSREVTAIMSDLQIHECAARYFGATQKYRAYPVINQQGTFLGMLDRDILQKGCQDHSATSELSVLFEHSAQHFAVPTETCQSIARRMAAFHLERLPVIADKDSMQLVGMISRSDLIKPTKTAFQEENVRERDTEILNSAT